MGFFHSSASTILRDKPSLIPKCGACGLYRGCQSPKMPVTGEGRKGILVIAEAPGSEEDDRNEQLIGPSGQELRRALQKCGIDLDRDCWKTNALICRPPENRHPTNDEIDYCRPNLLSALKELDPRVIVPLGATAVRSLLSPLWREDIGKISKWVGWKIPSQKLNSWITPIYHPSYVMRSKDQKEGPVIRLWFERHLLEMSNLLGRPWDKVPDYASQIRVMMDPDKAAGWIRSVINEGGPISFDLETNRLKPDSDDAEIICCSVCHRGEQTIAYPWVGEAIRATGEILRSGLPKIGANNKFEDRWVRKVFGFPVKNWVWDTMLSAHHLDQREGITSVKFQAFVRLGLSPWDEHIKPFLRSVDDSGLNRIRELELRDLLVYCGIDSAVEYEIAILQRKEMRGVS